MDVLITAAGQGKLAGSVSGGARLVLTQFAVGDGSGAPDAATTVDAC